MFETESLPLQIRNSSSNRIVLKDLISSHKGVAENQNGPGLQNTFVISQKNLDRQVSKHGETIFCA